MKRLFLSAFVGFAQSLLFLLWSASVTVLEAKPSSGQQQPPCPGNGCKGQGDDNTNSCDATGANPISPGKTNAYREVTDLTIFGPAPIAWTRQINSRLFQHVGSAYWEFGYYSMSDTATQWESSWQSNWTYELRNAGTDSSRNLILRYPNGNDYAFQYSGATPAPVGAQFVPSSENGDRIYKTASSPDKFTLLTADGEEFDFERTTYPALRLARKRDGLGSSWNLAYGSDGRISTITNNFGRSLQIFRQAGPDGKLRIWKVQASDGREVTYSYDNWTMGSSTHSVLTRVNYPEGQHADYTYRESDGANSQPLLETASDPLYGGAGARVKYVYHNPNLEAVGSVKEERNLLTNELIVSFPDGGGMQPTVVQGNGASLIFQYSPINGVVLAKGDGEGRMTTYSRDDGNTGFITSKQEPNQAITSYNRDYAGRVLTRTITDGSLAITLSNTYNAYGFLTSHTDEMGRVTTWHRASTVGGVHNSRVTKIDYPDNTYEEWPLFNTHSQPLQHRLRNGGTESFTYDALGNVLTETGAEGNLTKYTYYGSGLVQTMTDARDGTDTPRTRPVIPTTGVDSCAQRPIPMAASPKISMTISETGSWLKTSWASRLNTLMTNTAG